MNPKGLGRSLALGVAALGVFNTLSSLSMPVADRRPALAITLLVAVLLTAHAALYWWGDRVRVRFGLVTYVAAQAAIVFIVGSTRVFVPVTLVLYVALTVETVLIAGSRWGTMPITIGAIVLYGLGAIITSDLYRGATAGLVLAVTGLLAHALGALVRRGNPRPGVDLATTSNGVAAAVSLDSANGIDFQRRELARLTSREREVLQALTNGARSSEIADQLAISERTVKSHLASIYQKLGVESRTAAVAVALQQHQS
jgi:DNA-binding CsgD family transcriptional regulator